MIFRYWMKSLNVKAALGSPYGVVSGCRAAKSQSTNIVMKRYGLVLFIGLVTIFLPAAGFCQKLRPVTLGFTGKSLTTVIFETSIRRGHFKQQGLDLKLITIRQSDVIIKATMAGELNFMSVIPTAILASVRGLPIRTIAVNVDNAPYVLVGRPQIKSMSDLKRQKNRRELIGRHEHFAGSRNGGAQRSRSGSRCDLLGSRRQ